MAISGLQNGEVASLVSSDDVGAAVEALSLITPLHDRSKVEESVREDFARALESGVSGEPYIHVPDSVASLGQIVQALDNGTFRTYYLSTDVSHQFWAPGTGLERYTRDAIGLGDGLVAGRQVHARIAVRGSEIQEEPLLHFLGLPCDEYARQTWDPEAEATQLEKVAETRQAFEAEHPDFNVVPLDASAVGFIALMRRIKGERMPISCGVMHDASLPRRAVYAGSFVGSVSSYVGQLHLGVMDGRAANYIGVGLSVGHIDS